MAKTTFPVLFSAMSAAVAAWLLTPVGAQSTNTITLNRGIRYQTFRAWQAGAYAGQDHPAFANFQNLVLDEAAYNLGITRVDLGVRSGAENRQDYWSQFRSGQISSSLWRCLRYSTVNDNNDPFTINWAGFQFSELDDTIEKVVLPLKYRLAAKGERLEVSVTYVAFTKQMTAAGCPAGLDYVHDDSAEEYAEFVLATYLHMQQKYGWVPDYWQVILEPDNTVSWRGPEIGRAIVAAAARLRAAGFTPRFIAPSTTDMGHAWMYFDQMVAAVPGAPQEMVELSYHRYGGVLLSNLQAVADRARRYGLGAAMLEHIGSGHEDLHEDLKVGNNVAWQQNVLAGPNMVDDGSKYILVDPNTSRIALGSRTRYLVQYFRHIRPGAVRIEAATTNPALDPVAFINPDGTYAVVIKASIGANISISGLPQGRYGIRYTTAESAVDLPDITLGNYQWLDISIPQSGVIAIYGK